jgi:hypothetical protein
VFSKTLPKEPCGVSALRERAYEDHAGVLLPPPLSTLRTSSLPKLFHKDRMFCSLFVELDAQYQNEYEKTSCLAVSWIPKLKHPD